MATFTYNFDTRVVTVDAPDLTITIQELINSVADTMDELLNMDNPLIAEWEGKKGLGQPGDFTGITFTFLNGWKLDFALLSPGPVSSIVTGGNLLALEADGTAALSPIISGVNVVTIAQASSATFNDLQANVALVAGIDRNADLIESQRGAHTWQGDTWYVDPTNGSDSNAGTRLAPFATIAAAHTAATDSNHDVIFLVAGSTGITELDEQVTISKNYLFIRGPGNDFRWKSTSNGDVVTVTGSGVEISGVRIQTHSLGAGRGIDVSGSTFVKIQHVWIERSKSDGIRLLNCTNCVVQDNLLEDVGDIGSGDGISVNGTTGGSHNHILRNRVYDTQGAGIHVHGALSDHTVVEQNHCQGSLGYGISITDGATRTEVERNHLGNNTLGDINDLGVNTSQENNEQWAKETTLAAVPDAVWDEVLSGHALTGSAGAVLADILRVLDNRLEVDFSAQQLILYADDGITPIRRWPVETKDGENVATAVGVQTKRKVSII